MFIGAVLNLSDEQPPGRESDRNNKKTAAAFSAGRLPLRLGEGGALIVLIELRAAVLAVSAATCAATPFAPGPQRSRRR
ncbi:MAG: hypothetical protein A3B37_00765 [Candidatus Sungbacteria bacterium RIFCSPLOWO2_01_FULL_59_16]|uniref:Uncharacterized protein n=1 Tax=Candidatus Sungbacteria bacterium RIFCSPLOWO2_01_FULL_59_16 TaxID=1802280 RepID=A0A1G2LB49_9BACT|nr:MAG: hypothetical protein A3B37_00765 [Candidatus Sungbacteria bacterium RIFCSPLOWO2_01_FULL_59_16]